MAGAGGPVTRIPRRIPLRWSVRMAGAVVADGSGAADPVAVSGCAGDDYWRRRESTAGLQVAFQKRWRLVRGYGVMMIWLWGRLWRGLAGGAD